MTTDIASPDFDLFSYLRTACGEAWRRYTGHAFVRGLGDGTLPETCFRHYLGQDYLFLIHFARAYGLAAYKATTISEIRQASAGLSTVIDIEMDLHVSYCAEWGIDEADLEALAEAEETLAYTRFVLEKGLQGDLLDLHVALAPCMVGYGEIGKELAAGRGQEGKANPYARWIDMYASEEFQTAAREERLTLNRLMRERGGPGRLPALAETFGQATRLETSFWDMGLKARTPGA